MNDLIAALRIFEKYANDKTRRRPTHCEHDVLYVLVSPHEVSEADKKSLETLSFDADSERCCFYSFRFGSG